MVTINDFARRNPSTATAEETVREAARRMEACGVGCLVVVDADRRPIGMVTDRDLVMRLLRRRRDPDTTSVAEVMHPEVTSVSEDAPIERAMRRMHQEGIRRVPIVDTAGRLTGIFAADDALQLLASELAGVAEAVRAQFPPDLEAGHALPAKGG